MTCPLEVYSWETHRTDRVSLQVSYSVMLTILERTKQWPVSLVSLGTLKALGSDSIAWTSAMTATKNWQVPWSQERAPQGKICSDISPGRAEVFFSWLQTMQKQHKRQSNTPKHTCGEWTATHQKQKRRMGRLGVDPDFPGGLTVAPQGIAAGRPSRCGLLRGSPGELCCSKALADRCAIAGGVWWR